MDTPQMSPKELRGKIKGEKCFGRKKWRSSPLCKFGSATESIPNLAISGTPSPPLESWAGSQDFSSVDFGSVLPASWPAPTWPRRRSRLSRGVWGLWLVHAVVSVRWCICVCVCVCVARGVFRVAGRGWFWDVLGLVPKSLSQQEMFEPLLWACFEPFYFWSTALAWHSGVVAKFE